MTVDLAAALALFAMVSSITPGPNNLMLMASGTNYGFTRTIPHMIGVALGFVIMLILVGIGLVGIFDRFPVSYTVLKTVSVTYLLFLSWKIATADPLPEKGEPGSTVTKGTPLTFTQAALFQWVNPKAWAMALTAITAYTPPDHPLHSVFIVGLIFGLINFPSVSIWVLLGTQLRRLLGKPFHLRLFNITAAVLLIISVYPIFSSGAMG